MPCSAREGDYDPDDYDLDEDDEDEEYDADRREISRLHNRLDETTRILCSTLGSMSTSARAALDGETLRWYAEHLREDERRVKSEIKLLEQRLVKEEEAVAADKASLDILRQELREILIKRGKSVDPAPTPPAPPVTGVRIRRGRR